MNVLLVEDEDPKLAGVIHFLEEFHPEIHVAVARSVKSGLESLKTTLPHLLLLDMSLPTFDITAIEPGGRPQGFGGIEVIRYLDSIDTTVPTIVVSGYEAFAKDGKNIELKALASELMRDYPTIIRGVVYFNPLDGEWARDLERLLGECTTQRNCT
jgi:CheY-like chemotaxis protein